MKRTSYITNRLHDLIHQKFLSKFTNSVNTYWFREYYNAGDIVTPFLLKTNGLIPIMSAPSQVDIFLCGSILNHLPENYDGYIIGSGFRHDGENVQLENAKILAVRGENTKSRLGIQLNILLADPGLLLGNYVNQNKKKKFDFGLIPHYSEITHPRIQTLYHRNKKRIKLINIQQHPVSIMKEIVKCEVIISSSLHGVIFAHSVGIPSIWLDIEENIGKKDYKFSDYYSSITLEPNPYILSNNYSLRLLPNFASTLCISEIREKCNGLQSALNTFLKKNYSKQ